MTKKSKKAIWIVVFCFLLLLLFAAFSWLVPCFPSYSPLSNPPDRLVIYSNGESLTLEKGTKEYKKLRGKLQDASDRTLVEILLNHIPHGGNRSGLLLEDQEELYRQPLLIEAEYNSIQKDSLGDNWWEYDRILIILKEKEDSKLSSPTIQEPTGIQWSGKSFFDMFYYKSDDMDRNPYGGSMCFFRYPAKAKEYAEKLLQENGIG